MFFWYNAFFMKQIICIALCLAALFPLYAQSPAQDVISFDTIPSTMEKFLALRNTIANTPEGGAAIFAAALVMYSRDNQLGLQALTIALDRSNLSTATDVYKGYTPNSSAMYHITNNLKPRPYLARSYVMGTSPANKYAIPAGSVRIGVSRNAYSTQPNGDIKVFVDCSGADSPRPIILRENNRGLWKAVNYSSLFVGIRKPIEQIDDDL